MIVIHIKDKKLYRQMFTFLNKKQKIEFVFVLLILVCSAALTQFTPVAVGYLTDHVLAGKNIEFPIVVPILIFILIINIVNEVIKVIRRLLVEDTATHVEKAARQKAADSLLKAPLAYYRNHMTGNIHGRLNRSLEGTTKLVKLIFMDFAPSIATSIAAIVVIFTKLPIPIACITVLVIPVGLAIVLRQITTQKGIRIELLDTKAEMDGTMVELLGGIETIRALDSVQIESGRIGKRSEQLRGKEMKHHKAMAFYDCLKFINEALFNVLVIAISVFLAAKGTITIGTVLTAYLCFTQLTGPLRELHRILDEFSECMVLANDYFEMVELPEDFSYSYNIEGTPEKKLANNEIILNNVSFFYTEKPGTNVLKEINLTIRPGEFLGVAGPSGCGKSTLIKAIDKLEPCQGKILVGGANLASLSRQTLAENIALVPQTPFLVADTIFHNISYGMKRNVSLEEVREAAAKACIEDVIDRLPGKYEFKISEGGGNLSGGQRQRIALARVFLRKPRILILDEATSALDNTSEKNIQNEIEKMKKEVGTTVISIAHRLSTLRNCDEIIVIDKGQIVQKGSYGELASVPGIFRDMERGILK